MAIDPVTKCGARARPGVLRVAILVAAVALVAPRPSDAADARPQTKVGFWAGESVPGTDWSDPATYWNRRSTRVYTPGLWKALSRNRTPLYFGLRYGRDFGPVPPGMPHRRDGLRIVRKANRLGVPVWGWILIPYSDGYWAWEGAAAEHLEAVKSLVRWAREEDVRLAGIVLDPESPLNTPFDASAAVLGGGAQTGFASLFRSTVDPARQCAAWNGYRQILFWGRKHDVKISAAPSATALDDVYDSGLALQDAADYIVPTGPWHELFFQAYRSVFSYYRGEDPGSGIITSYLRTARHWFGRAGQVTLGSAGRGKYRRLANLVHDVRLTATLGVSHVPIYSLERTVRAYGPGAVGRLARAGHEPFVGRKRNRATSSVSKADAVRATIRVSDATTARATPTITAGFGALQHANPWPGACGS
jgi:hypothetical protein